jgi:hypothetical protein
MAQHIARSRVGWDRLGVTELEASAFEFRWWGSGDRGILSRELLVRAVEAEQERGWTERIAGRRYLADLVELALDLEETPGLEETPRFWAGRLEWMDSATWLEHGAPRLKVFRAPFEEWVQTAIAKARQAGAFARHA